MKPVCSIIIPHYNNTDSLIRCLKELNTQTINRSSYEVILVDNGSVNFDEDTVDIYVDKLIIYNDRKDPYNCRNVGVDSAISDIIIFLDSKCVPSIWWLEKGLEYFIINDLELLAGHFDIKVDTSDFYQISYSLIFLDNFHLNKIKAGFPAGNLMLSKSVFKKVGRFVENCRSGEDTRFSERVKKRGFCMDYCAEMSVEYEAKKKEDLLDAAKRHGRSISNSIVDFKSLLSILKLSLPMNPLILNDKIRRKEYKLNPLSYLYVTSIILRVRWVILLEFLKSLIRKR